MYRPPACGLILHLWPQMADSCPCMDSEKGKKRESLGLKPRDSLLLYDTGNANFSARKITSAAAAAMSMGRTRLRSFSARSLSSYSFL